MTDPTQHAFLTTAIQAVGMILVAGIMLPMARVIPGLFLRYWSVGWLCRAIALFLLFASVALRPAEPYFLAAHCLFEYLFGFMLWAGCRELTTRRPLRLVHFAALAPPAVFALVAPFVLPA